MTPIDKLLKAAKKAVDAIFSDQSVSQEETLSRLKDLADHIAICKDALSTDMIDENLLLQRPRYRIVLESLPPKDETHHSIIRMNW